MSFEVAKKVRANDYPQPAFSPGQTWYGKGGIAWEIVHVLKQSIYCHNHDYGFILISSESYPEMTYCPTRSEIEAARVLMKSIIGETLPY